MPPSSRPFLDSRFGFPREIPRKGKFLAIAREFRGNGNLDPVLIYIRRTSRRLSFSREFALGPGIHYSYISSSLIYILYRQVAGCNKPAGYIIPWIIHLSYKTGLAE